MYWTDYERLSDLNLLADDTRSETRLLQCYSRAGVNPVGLEARFNAG